MNECKACSSKIRRIGVVFMQRIALKKICDIYDGPHATPKKISEGPIYLGIDAINSDGKIDYSQCAHLSEEDYKKWTKRVTPKEGDIVFSYEATLGRYALIPEGFNGCLGRRLAVIRNKSNNINERWLYYYFRSPEWTAFIQQQTVKGSTVNRISVEDFPEYTVPLMPLEKQNLIAEILSRLDRKIELNNLINDNLQQQTQLIFDYIFQDLSGSKHVGDFIIPQRGTALSSKDTVLGDVPVVAGGLEPSTYHNIANTLAPVITISSSGANAGFVNLWGIPVWSSDSSYIDSSMTPYVYFWYAFLKRHQNNIYRIQTGSAQPHIYPNHIISLPISNIDYKKVDEYTQIVTPIFLTITENHKENHQLKSVRDWLLPMLMNGQTIISD